MFYRKSSLFITALVTTNIVLASQTAFAQLDEIPGNLPSDQACEDAKDGNCLPVLEDGEGSLDVIEKVKCDPRELSSEEVLACLKDSWGEEFDKVSKGAFKTGRCEPDFRSETSTATSMACGAKESIEQKFATQSRGGKAISCDLGPVDKLDPDSGCLAKQLIAATAQSAREAGHGDDIEACLGRKRPGRCLEQRDVKRIGSQVSEFFPMADCKAPKDGSDEALNEYAGCAITSVSPEVNFDIRGFAKALAQSDLLSDANGSNLSRKQRNQIGELARGFAGMGAGDGVLRGFAFGIPRVEFRVRRPSKCAGRTTTVNWYISIGPVANPVNIHLGTGGDDVIAGTNQRDVLIGFGGSDVLCGRAKRDYLFGDLLFPFGQLPGNDEIHGDRDSDFALGGSGDDKIFGAHGNDLLVGESGDDTILGGSQPDWIYGGQGADKLLGDGGNDRIVGGEGDDVVFGGGDHDLVLAGLGNDSVDAGAGNDFVVGHDGDDRLYGGGGTDSIYGGNGHDVVDGQGGSDYWLSGGAGNDRVRGGQGNEFVVSGGPGNDNVAGQQGADYIVSGGSGADIVSGGAGMDNVYGGFGNDELEGNAGPDRIYGGNGNDTINGGPGEDYIEGNAGDDRIFGAGGFDRIVAGSGNDNVDGGAGNDFIEGGDGLDTLVGSGGNDIIDGGADADIISGQQNSDWLFGRDGNDSIEGGAATDFVFGDAGNDQLFGGPSVDLLFGNDGDDQLFGQGNVDTLTCGNGNDFAHGGSGPDSCISDCETQVSCP